MAVGNIFLRSGSANVNHVFAYLLFSIWQIARILWLSFLFFETGYLKISQRFLWQEIRKWWLQNALSWFGCHLASCLSLYRNVLQQNKNPSQPNSNKHIAHNCLFWINCFRSRCITWKCSPYLSLESQLDLPKFNSLLYIWQWD